MKERRGTGDRMKWVKYILEGYLWVAYKHNRKFERPVCRVYTYKGIVAKSTEKCKMKSQGKMKGRIIVLRGYFSL